MIRWAGGQVIRWAGGKVIRWGVGQVDRWAGGRWRWQGARWEGDQVVRCQVGRCATGWSLGSPSWVTEWLTSFMAEEARKLMAKGSQRVIERSPST